MFADIQSLGGSDLPEMVSRVDQHPLKSSENGEVLLRRLKPLFADAWLGFNLTKGLQACICKDLTSQASLKLLFYQAFLLVLQTFCTC